VSLWDSLLGRSKPKAANLDALFAVPQAALTLEAGADFKPTGVGAVCYRQNEGGAFSTMQTDIQELLDADGGPAVERTSDSFGFTWLVCRHDAFDISGLVNELHAVNATLEGQGFGPSLLCSYVGFDGPDGRPLGLVSCTNAAPSTRSHQPATSAATTPSSCKCAG
jgi:hypothetical protein